MTRKILELKNSRAEAIKKAEAALAGGDDAAYDEAMKEVARLNGEIERAETLKGEQERFGVVPTLGAEPKKANGFETLMKMLRGKRLSEEEQKLVGKGALISGDNAANGENYLIPEDVQTAIREKRKTYVSAKDLVNVIPTSYRSGSTVFEAAAPAGLTDFDDGDAIGEETPPKFVQKSWKIGNRGKIIPISRILADNVKGLMGYLDHWFLRSAIVTENEKIFGVLKGGYNSGAPKAVTGWKALKRSINVDLDPSYLNGAVIVTNQSGFACLDAEEDADGRPVLQSNPTHPTEKLFQGLPVKIFPDAQLPNIDSTHFPMIYGATASGADYMEYDGLTFDISEHYLFNKNQNCLRVIEGFDCYSTDTDAYIYASFSATAKGDA